MAAPEPPGLVLAVRTLLGALKDGARARVLISDGLSSRPVIVADGRARGTADDLARALATARGASVVPDPGASAGSGPDGVELVRAALRCLPDEAIASALRDVRLRRIDGAAPATVAFNAVERAELEKPDPANARGDAARAVVLLWAAQALEAAAPAREKRAATRAPQADGSSGAPRRRGRGVVEQLREQPAKLALLVVLVLVAVLAPLVVMWPGARGRAVVTTAAAAGLTCVELRQLDANAVCTVKRAAWTKLDATERGKRARASLSGIPSRPRSLVVADENGDVLETVVGGR